jgi:hypothetical protein
MFIPSPKKVDPMTPGMRRQLSNQNLKEQWSSFLSIKKA